MQSLQSTPVEQPSTDKSRYRVNTRIEGRQNRPESEKTEEIRGKIKLEQDTDLTKEVAETCYPEAGMMFANFVPAN